MASRDLRKLAREIAGEQGHGSSMLLFTLVGLVAALLAWAALTEIDNVTRGVGRTVSAAQNQFVQSSAAGVLERRYFSEGDRVGRGEVLFDIDPVEARAQMEQAEQRRAALRVSEVRLRAEVDGETPNFPADLAAQAPDAVATETALYRARLDDLRAQTAILGQRRKQRLTEIEELGVSQQTADNSLALIRDEMRIVEPLVAGGLAPETRLITLRRDEEAAVGRSRSSQSAQERVRAGLGEIDQQLRAARQAYVTGALTDLAGVSAALSELEAGLPALRGRVERTAVRSPVDGVINRVHYTTEGAYVRPGDVLIEIVPTGGALIVEARIDPRDIADVGVGDAVRVSLSAFDPTKYGRIDGRVRTVSADAIAEPKTGTLYYRVEVTLQGTFHEEDGSAVTILPGMVSTIEVLTGKRTVLNYFWQPIAHTRDRALRD